MNKKLLFLPLLAALFTFCSSANAREKSDVKRQLWKNFHISWDVNKTDDYRWRNFSLGTGYGKNFDFDKRTYWLVGLDLNFGKYTLYSDGAYAMGDENAKLRTTSLSIPAVIGYNVYKKTSRSLKIYTGPVLERILSSRLDGEDFDEIQRTQFGWTVGTNFRFLFIFGARVSYSYYPTGLFTNGDLKRSGVNFSLGF